ncbi:MAG TPA: alpha/beta hydrolase-fold protein [Mycobacteriales bacterium]|nr:alpha/beta hydrolase-fold protein [Mycobacteriales bacterium]
MDLLGLSFLLILVVVAVGLCAGVGLLWPRWPRGLRLPGRCVSLLLVMAMGAVLAGDVVNRRFGLYASFTDLLGQGSAISYEPPDSFGVRPEETRLTVLTRGWQALGSRAAQAGRGILLDVIYGGGRSGISRPGLLYLPAVYFTSQQDRRLPAIELFHGTPGRARNYRDQMHIDTILDAEIAAGRVPPVLAVIPTTYERTYSDCVDAVHGERDETYLAVDVPADVETAFRVLPGRSFAALGFSTGGFCAVNLALHHPDRYAAAASLSGFFTPGQDPGTARLYGHSQAARQRNSPLWWIMHRHPSAPPLYLVASTDDPATMREDDQLAAMISRHARRLPSYIAQISGGHNYGTWQAAIRPALDWVSGYLPISLAPPLTLPPAPAAAPSATWPSSRERAPRTSTPTVGCCGLSSVSVSGGHLRPPGRLDGTGRDAEDVTQGRAAHDTTHSGASRAEGVP